MPDLEQWPTKQQVRDRLNISDRAVDRLVEQKQLRKLSRRVFGRRPVPIYNPEDVETLGKASTVTGSDWLPTNSLPGERAEKAVSTVPDPQLAAAQALAQLIETIRDRFVSELAPLQMTVAALSAPATPSALYLTMSEACAYSGLPEGRLRAFIKHGKLTRVAGAHNRTMIARGELENLWTVIRPERTTEFRTVQEPAGRRKRLHTKSAVAGLARLAGFGGLNWELYT